MAQQTFSGILSLLIILTLVTACEKQQEVVEDVRALKTITVSAPATGQVRKFSGTVSATNSASVSFQVGGKVEVVNVDIGDAVKKDQIIAVLDKEPYELDVEAAQAEVVSAQAKLVDSKGEYERQDRVYRQGAGTKSRLDSAKYNYEAAKSAVDYSTAKLNIAKRDLRKTELEAPYNGNVALRLVDPGEEVTSGQKVFEIDSEGAMEVTIAVPETTISRIDTGTQVTLTFPSLPDRTVQGEISYIGSAAVKSNAFPVKIGLVDAPAGINPGMTAEASLILNVVSKDEGQEKGYLVPIHALLAAKEPKQGYVFIYDPKSSMVKKTLVHTSGEQHNMVIISDGLSAGDVIAVAGVSFLADGMKVTLMK